MLAFSAYVEKTWIAGQFDPKLWTHYDNDGPRTTNHAEGWHNALNHNFGISHPSTRTFLNWLQNYQFEIQCRGIQLDAGRSAKARSEIYVKLDNDIMNAKIQLSLTLGNIFVNVSPFENINVDTWKLVDIELLRYIKRVAHLIGLN